MDGYVTIGTELDTKSFDAQIEAVERKLNDLISDYDTLSKEDTFNEQSNEAIQLRQEIEKTSNKLEILTEKQNELDKAGLENISSKLNGIGNSIEGITKKVKKWALAIFGVRSAYMFIRQAMSTLSQSDEQLATNIEYIKWALATTIKPIIEWIVKAVYTVLSLIGSLVKAIFGVNIFANATANAFKKQKESMNGTNKEAKQLQKTLAGFDEMNVLQENGTTTPGGGGGGFTPEIDLGNLKNPGFIKGLKNFWKEIFDFWEKDWKDVFNNLDGKWGAFIGGIILTVKGFWDVLKGIGELIIGLVQMLVGLVTGNFDLVKQGFNIMIEGIKNILIGTVEIITGLLLTLFGFVKGIFLEIWDFIYKYLISPLIDAFTELVDIMKKPINAFVDAVEGIWGRITDAVGTLKNELGGVFDEIKKIFKKPINAFVNGIKGIWEKIKEPLSKLVDKTKKKFDKLNPVHIGVSLGKKIGEFFGFAKGGIVVPKLASGGVINQPGRGVPIASAVGGERGAEGVIPLTDSQQMALLGETIGRYVNISATIPVYVGNRKVAREVRKIQANEDFAFNR